MERITMSKRRYILHANQTVGVRGSWGYETLRSNSTFAIDADSEAQALKIAEKQVRERYTQPGQTVEHVSITSALTRVIELANDKGTP
jgi:hypothetical protein